MFHVSYGGASSAGLEPERKVVAVVPTETCTRIVPLHLCMPIPAAKTAFSPRVADFTMAHSIVRKDPAFGRRPAFADNTGRGGGWVEPNPANAPRRGRGDARFATMPVRALQHILAFVDERGLSIVAVFVNREWCNAIRSSALLNRRRLSFNFTGRDYDDGILGYLGQRNASAAALQRVHADWQGSAHGAVLDAVVKSVTNPALALRPLVRVACSSLHGVVVDSKALAAALCGGRPARFATEKIPFAWVGVDMLHFAVVPTAYTLSASPDATDALPLTWEFQASSATGAEDWDAPIWDVLDKRLGCGLEHGRTATFQLTTQRKYKRFRVVQTSVNSLWGHELVVSGLELYGTLLRDALR
jgi:hypothetical protein